MIRIKMKTCLANAKYACRPGGTIAVDDKFAKHLVDGGWATYVEPEAAEKKKEVVDEKQEAAKKKKEAVETATVGKKETATTRSTKQAGEKNKC